jgi:uncharacterized Rossmann fold enzyme
VLQVACIKVGSRYGADYVNILYDMVSRNLQSGFPGQFVCFTDDPSGLDPAITVRKVPEDLAHRGWFSKLWLFSKDAFPDGGRVLYFDLDTVITGPLDAIAMCSNDFAILRDAYRPKGLQSSVMAWEAGRYEHVWDSWNAAGRPEVEGGDQTWIEQQIPQADILQQIYPKRFRSYKVECRFGIPHGTSVVFFHGFPRPHEVTEGWVPQVWKTGGGSGTEFIVRSNMDDETLREHVQFAIYSARKWVSHGDDPRTALIVGGGPSLKEHLFYVRGMQAAGAKIYAVGNTFRYLLEQGIRPEAHVLLDARWGNLEFVPEIPCERYYASQCHPAVLKAAGEELICWHAAFTSYHNLIEKHSLAIGGGTTVGLKAMALAYVLGHRHIRLFGFDSCYQDTHHAYSQPLNDGEKTLEVHMGGKSFKCAPWMITQAEDFKEIIPELVSAGCVIRVYGEGLIPHIASLMKPLSVDERANQLLQWLESTKNPKGAEIGVFAGELSRRLLARPDLTLLMVDSWKAGAGQAGLGDFHAELTQVQQDHYLGVTRSATDFAGERAQIRVLDSLEAARHIPDDSLDFVFIDADHSYEACKADILAWLPKIKPSGFISGHDYDNPDFPMWGVKQAVTEIFGEPEIGANFTWRVRLAETWRMAV